MGKALKQFTIKKLREPTEKEVDKDIRWICNSLGFITPRDQDDTAFEILKALVKSAKENKGMTSEQLTELVQPTIGSVIYHLKRLTKAGLVIKLDSKYELRMSSLLTTIDEIKKDTIIILDDIKKVAKDVDDKIGLEHR